MMKASKIILPVALILILFTGAIFGQESNKPFRRSLFTLTLKGAYMVSEDDDYIDMYGKSKYAPEAEIEIRFYRNFYIWGSYTRVSAGNEWFEWSSKSLVDPDFRWEITSTKQWISFGLGYFIGLIEPGEVGIKLEAGVCLIVDKDVSDKHLIATDTVTDSIIDKENHIGAIGRLGGTYGLWKSLFAEAAVSYTYATEIRVVDEEDTRFQLGGLKITVGLGYKF